MTLSWTVDSSLLHLVLFYDIYSNIIFFLVRSMNCYFLDHSKKKRFVIEKKYLLVHI